MNPPYFKNGSTKPSPDPRRNLERIDATATPADVARAASRLLTQDGTLCLVLRPARLDDYLAALAAEGFSPCELVEASHSPTHSPSAILIKAQKNFSYFSFYKRKIYLFGEKGEVSPEYSQILLGAPL